MNRDLTWRCHVCGTRRSDEEIGVVSRDSIMAGGVSMRHSLRYCIDDPECSAAASEWLSFEEPILWNDGLIVKEREPMPKTQTRWWLYAAVALAAVIILALAMAVRGEAHLAYKTKVAHPSREQIHALQSRNLHHARYVCRHGGGHHRRWSCRAAEGWLLREWKETQPETVWWISKQIAVAEKLGAAGDQAGTDPWPNCPDPYDHAGHSWIDTLACENRGYYERFGNTPDAWRDSPGYFRCGLQFKPSWESVYGRLCP